MKKFTLIFLGLVILLISACSEGPAEKKGKSIDQAVENVKDKIQNKGPAQKAGEKIDEVTEN
jgi:uncharacterized lipoprotein